MTRTELLALLAQHKPVLAERFGVNSLRLFGSFARDTAREDSDVDVLVRFNGPPTSDQYFGVQFYLEDMLEFSQDVIDYAQGLTLAAWQADAMRVDATLRKLSLIGEAATRVPDSIRLQASLKALLVALPPSPVI